MFCCKRTPCPVRPRSRRVILLVALSWVALHPSSQAYLSPPNSPAPVVCIDPGHPSETSRGTRGRSGLTEMHVNWAVAVRLKNLLERRGIAVVMTKGSEGEWVSNRRRAEIANAAHASLFLRLHCDDGAGSGAATYYPDRRGKSQGVTGPSRDVLKRSEEAARRFHPAMMARLRESFGDRGIRKESRSRVGAKQGALTGSIFSQVPALTVEMCLLNDRHDEKLAGTEAGQTLLAEGLERGVMAVLKP